MLERVRAVTKRQEATAFLQKPGRSMRARRASGGLTCPQLQHTVTCNDETPGCFLVDGFKIRCFNGKGYYDPEIEALEKCFWNKKCKERNEEATERNEENRC